jgi:hypothetical protein
MFQACDRIYGPEHIAVMGSAFERTCGSLSTWTNDNNDDVRETLARIILWHFDLGEHDPVRLSNLALDTFVSCRPSDDSATAGASQRGPRSPSFANIIKLS